MSNIERLETFVKKLSEMAYEELAAEEKGFDSFEALLEAIEIDDVNNIDRLGILLIANRISKVAWQAGYESRLIDEVIDLTVHDVDKLERLEEQ